MSSDRARSWTEIRERAARQRGSSPAASVSPPGSQGRRSTTRSAPAASIVCSVASISWVIPSRRRWRSRRAALMAVAPGGVLSHHTAANLHGLLPGRGAFHVTNPHRRCRTQRGLSRTPPSSNPTRSRSTTASASRAHSERSTTSPPSWTRPRSSARPTKRRSATWSHAARRHPHPKSRGRRKLLALLRKAGLPPTATNARVAGFEVDVLYAEQKVVVEFDSSTFHGTRSAVERDRRKDAALRLAGYDVVRVTWRPGRRALPRRPRDPLNDEGPPRAALGVKQQAEAPRKTMRPWPARRRGGAARLQGDHEALDLQHAFG